MSLTLLIRRMQKGDAGARRRVFEESYHDLRDIAGKLMKYERPAHTLGATGLLHEVILGPLQFLTMKVQGRAHFYALAALSMRRTLLDHGRRRGAEKRTSGETQQKFTKPTDPRVLDLIKALDELRKQDEHAALVVDMKHFLGLTLEEIAAETGRPYRQIRDDWDFARGWLGRRLAG